MSTVESVLPRSESVAEGNDTKWLASGSLVTVNGTLLGRIVQLGGQVALARLLGPATFGLYAVGWTLVRMATIVTPLGLDSGVIHCGTRYAGVDQRRFRSVLNQSLLFALLFGALVGLAVGGLAPVLARRVFGKNELLPVIVFFAAAFPLAASLKVAAAGTRLSQSMKYGVYAEELMLPAVNLVLFLAFYLIGWRLLGAVAAAVLSFAASLALAISYERKLFPATKLPRHSESAPVASELLEFSLFAWLGVVFINLVPWIDRLFVGAYLAPADVGAYQAAAQASAILSFISGALIVVVSPRVSLLYQNSEFERVQQVYRVVTKWIFYSSFPFLLVFCFVPRQLLGVVYGPGFEAAGSSLLILSIARLIDALAGPTGIMLVFTGRQRLFSVISGGGLILSALLNRLCIPRFGAAGAALATGMANTMMLLVLVLTIRNTLGTWPYDGKWYKGVVASVATICTLFVVQHISVQPRLVDLLFRFILSATVFLGCLLLLGLDEEDRELILTFKVRLLAFASGAKSDAW